MAKIQRALISVSDKDGLLPFAKTLAEAGVEILSTGGTARVMREAGLTVIDVSDYTGFMYLGRMVEFNKTEKIFSEPDQELTQRYITGRFG